MLIELLGGHVIWGIPEFITHEAGTSVHNGKTVRQSVLKLFFGRLSILKYFLADNAHKVKNYFISNSK